MSGTEASASVNPSGLRWFSSESDDFHCGKAIHPSYFTSELAFFPTDVEVRWKF